MFSCPSASQYQDKYSLKFSQGFRQYSDLDLLKVYVFEKIRHTIPNRAGSSVSFVSRVVGLLR